ncbi:MAG: hypothetical protein ABIF11_08140 [Nitrospirota bacterium]
MVYLLFPIECRAKTSLPEGYLLFVVVETYGESKFGAISSGEEAEKIFSRIKYKDCGVALSSLYYNENDLNAYYYIAKVAQNYGIHLWASSFKIIERIQAFGKIKPEYQACVMQKDGSIIPATLNDRPLFDVLNEDAVTWFLQEYKTRYLQRFKGILNGYFFDEDVLTYLDEWRNEKRYDYWSNPTYSPAILKKWQEYAMKHNVRHNGKLVDKFPVHDPSMVSELTEYCPGYNVPVEITPGQRFVDLSKPEGVWKHWFDFICELFINNWIGRIAGVVNEVNKDNPQWYGTVYIGLHHWTLPYEKIIDKDFTVPEIHRWGAWGRQRGMDIELLSQHPEIDYVVCETYPPIKANLEYFIEEYKRLVNADLKFGLMLHRDDRWKLNLDEEKSRWELIKRYRPRLLVQYPIKNIFEESEYYSKEGEKYFSEQLNNYRRNVR